MNPELKAFLLEIGTCALVGAVVGMLIRWLRPDWSRQFVKFSLNRQWKLFAFGALFFGAGGVLLWYDGNTYYALLCVAMCVLELVALFLYGFKTMTPEMEAKIDRS